MQRASCTAIDRRAFLARLGVLGAAVALGSAGPLRSGWSARADTGPDLTATLDGLVADTLAGLAAFVVPGPDRYSLAQGASSAEDGGMAARTAEFLVTSLDHFFPVPQEVLRPAVAALATGLGDMPLALPLSGVLAAVPVGAAATLDAALAPVLAGRGTARLSLWIALLLNQLATVADPASVHGPFPSPFANLSFAKKAEVFRLLEEDGATVVALLDAQASEPMRQSWSGLLAFTAGALLEFTGFGAYSEWAVLAGHDLTAVPVGWHLTGAFAATGHQPVDGWADFIGYYQDRRSVER